MQMLIIVISKSFTLQIKQELRGITNISGLIRW